VIGTAATSDATVMPAAAIAPYLPIGGMAAGVVTR